MVGSAGAGGGGRTRDLSILILARVQSIYPTGETASKNLAHAKHRQHFLSLELTDSRGKKKKEAAAQSFNEDRHGRDGNGVCNDKTLNSYCH